MSVNPSEDKDAQKKATNHENAIAGNQRLSAKNKRVIGIAGIIAALLLGLIVLGLAAHHRHRHYQGPTPAASTDKPLMVPLSNIANLTTSATGSAISDINSHADVMQKKLADERDKVTQLSKKLSALSAQMTAFEKKAQATPKVNPPSAGTTPATRPPAGPHPAGQGNGAMPPNQNLPPYGAGGAGQAAQTVGFSGARVFQFSPPVDEKAAAAAKGCDATHCLLPGSFAKAVIIGGADANASVNGQSNTTPILMRVLSNATGPNHSRQDIKDCMVVGTVYGDISSERGEVKLTHLSCVKHGKIISRNITLGTAYDIGGKEGVRGDPVMRNGKLLLYAGLSGMASGVGSAIQQSATTQSTSPLGTTSTIAPGQIGKYGAATGASTALGKLADYYIKRADQYHPIIQLNAGTVVDVVFLSQVSLRPGNDDTQGDSESATTSPSQTGAGPMSRAHDTLATTGFDSQLNTAMAKQVKASIAQHYGGQQ